MSATVPTPPGQERRIAVHVGGACELNCAPCDCRTKASDTAWMVDTVRQGARRLTLRGSPSSSPVLDEVLQAAKTGRVEEVVVRTNGHAYADPAAAAALAAKGVHVALLPVFSANPALHDRIAGKPGALSLTLAGMRALSAAGLSVEVETALVDPKYTTPVSVLELAHRAVPTLRAIHTYVPRWRLPAALAPLAWPDAVPLIEAVAERARQLHVAYELRESDAIPLCALKEKPELHALHKFDPRTTGALQPGCEYVDCCVTCSVREQCPGVATPYRELRGSQGISAWNVRPRTLTEQRTTSRRAWTEEQRRAARDAQILVLRPTVNCNQDCTFCSANETTGNVWTDPQVMYRQVVRAAQRGIRYLSFSGGEPTLSKELPSFIRVARRAGIPKVEIVSNAVLLDRKEKVDALRNAGLTHAFISLHAHDEAVSRALTQKVGDWERTVRAVGLLLDAGVSVTLNHVVNARNFQHLPHFIRFVAERFGSRAGVSIAFVTPQYKALENLDLVPRFTDVKPFLRRALHVAVERGVPVVVGSRQGVPPCFLGEFRAWSDVLHLANEGASEDSFQKGKGPQCGSCAYASSCTGLWRPYAAREGYDELVPVPGPAIGEAERIDLDARVKERPFGRPALFDDVPERLRDRALEEEGRALAAANPAEIPANTRRPLPIVESGRTRPLRWLLAGTGPRARVLAASMQHVAGISLDGVASPHATTLDLTPFGHCPAWSDVTEALDDMRPEGLIVASSTASHLALVTQAIERGIPVLVEKPVGRNEAEIEAIRSLAAAKSVPVLVAHNDVFIPGFDVFEERAKSHATIGIERRVGPRHVEVPRVWGRASISELVQHPLSLAIRVVGPVVAVDACTWDGEMAPRRLSWKVTHASGSSTISFDFAHPTDVLLLESGPHVLKREGRSVWLDDVPVASNEGELVAMLADFREVVHGRVAPRVTLDEGLDVLKGARLLLVSLEAAGAPLDRLNAPKHVASRELTDRRDRP